MKRRLYPALMAIALLACSFFVYEDFRSLLLCDADLTFYLENNASVYQDEENIRTTEYTVLEAVLDDKPQLKLNALSAAVTDSANGRLLYGRSADDRLPMASTTKIMTCIYTLENCDVDEIVTFSKYAASMPDVQLNAKEGEQFYLKDLLYSLMLESHNDTAVAIAEHVSGSVEDFCSGMTALAKKIGAADTAFETPNGLDSDGHFTTAHDLCIIGAYALENKDFVAVTNTASHTFSNLAGTRSYSVSNKNAFLSMMDGALGIKTGFTGKAGYCFVGALKTKSALYVSAVLASGWPPHKTYKWSDTKTLMNYAINNFNEKNIYDSVSQKIMYLPVQNGTRRNVLLDYPDNAPELTLLLADWEAVTASYRLPRFLTAPITAGAPIGSVTYKIDGTAYASYEICAADSIDEMSLFYLFKKLLEV